ncbi:hypothetical protein PENTCL1PPCAC_19160, partial [Pristionchus entomophagus]
FQMLPSTVSAPLLCVLLLVCCAAAAGADPVARQDSSPSFSLPAPDPQQTHGIATFRLKHARPCECLNGGRCHMRKRKCQCPLGHGGDHCEIVDHQLLAAVEEAQATSAAPAKTQQQLQQEGEQRERERQPQPRPLFTAADWLFYVPLAVSVLLLGALLRVFGVLAASYLGDKIRPLTVTVLARPMDDKASNSIYTLPLPPPYSEKDVVGFVHSTPCSKQQLQQLHEQRLQSNYYMEPDSSRPFEEYAVVV